MAGITIELGEKNYKLLRIELVKLRNETVHQQQNIEWDIHLMGEPNTHQDKEHVKRLNNKLYNLKREYDFCDYMLNTLQNAYDKYVEENK